MKFGNTSQTSVPVPNLFLNNEINQMETFKVNKGKKYFRERDLFQKTKEINFSNFTRNLTRKHENFNKTKHKIDISSLNNFLNRSNQTTSKLFDFPKGDPNKDSYENFRNFMEKTNISKYTSSDLRGEIKSNINVLIEKINHTYDLDKWQHTDTRTNFIDTNTDYLKNKNIFETVKNDFYSVKTCKNKNIKENESYRFKSVIREKVEGMSIDNEYKKKLLSKIDMNNNSFSEKFYKTKNSTIIDIHSTDDILKTDASEDKNNKQMNTLSNMTNLKNKKNNFNPMKIVNDEINLKKICYPSIMNKYSYVSNDTLKNQMEIDKLKMANSRIYSRFDNTNMFRDFPSPDRKEFIKKRGEKLRLNTKQDKIDKSIVDFSGYNTTKHRDIFCEKYDTNQGFMEKFRKSKDSFV